MMVSLLQRSRRSLSRVSDLIDLDHPNYQFVARLLLFSLRKQIYGKEQNIPSLVDHITENVYNDHYDKGIFEKYSLEDIEQVESFLDHGRDFLFTYARFETGCG